MRNIILKLVKLSFIVTISLLMLYLIIICGSLFCLMINFHETTVIFPILSIIYFVTLLLVGNKIKKWLNIGFISFFIASNILPLVFNALLYFALKSQPRYHRHQQLPI